MRRFSVLLLCAAGMSSGMLHRAEAQWQLPPGTSSSVDDDPPKPAVDARTKALSEAEARLEAQDWVAAAALLQPLAANAADERANYDLGYALDAADDVPGAKAAYARALAADAKAPAPRIALGLLLARSGDATEAEQMLSAAVALPASGEIAVTQRAQAYRALARLHLPAAPDQSRDDLAAALKLSPETPADTVLAGEIAEALHADKESLQAYERAWRNAPTDPDLTLKYVRALDRNGEGEKAKQTLLGALTAHPDQEALQKEQAALLLKSNEVSKAVPLLERLYRANPTDQEAARLLARGYIAVGDTEKAMPIYQELAKATPDDGDLFAAYGDALIRQKRNLEAEALLDKALAAAHFLSADGRAQAAAELAFAASADHHPEVVLRAVKVRDDTLPPDASSSFLLATAHDTLHHRQQAAESYRQFLQLANGKFPDEEWQAKQRLQILSRAK